MEKYYKKIFCRSWADTFIHAYSFGRKLNAKIKICTKYMVDLYAENYVIGDIDYSDLAGVNLHVHGPISRKELESAADNSSVRQIILLLEKDGNILEYVRNTKGDIICVYHDEEELELAEGVLSKISCSD